MTIMCGIYGYIGGNPAYPIILNGLQKLEYRGYDSWGMVTLANGHFHQVKRLGYITKSSITETALPGNVGIGHVRWATHGSNSEKNAHPHFDCKNELAIVHNGVIYNEDSIRNKLVKNGHILNSDTDSELFAHLLEEKAEKDFISAIYECVKEIDAQYAFLILNKKTSKIYATRKESPIK
ncbi:MAG: glutamine--fructose-6-phosphate aminotransferase, partial [Proteobacteria bacterium]|nr:glutamine--fructose-6-phosphate aminotransferase [Pseudomonadota bacterium]